MNYETQRNSIIRKYVTGIYSSFLCKARWGIVRSSLARLSIAKCGEVKWSVVLFGRVMCSKVRQFFSYLLQGLVGLSDVLQGKVMSCFVRWSMVK